MKNISTNGTSPMLKAFLEQSNLDFEGAILRDQALTEWQNEQYQKARMQLEKSGNIILNAIEEQSGLRDRSQIHDNLKNYDHSLELDRRDACKIKDGKYMLNHENGLRPVEKDGKIEYESTLSIDDLLKLT